MSATLLCRSFMSKTRFNSIKFIAQKPTVPKTCLLKPRYFLHTSSRLSSFVDDNVWEERMRHLQRQYREKDNLSADYELISITNRTLINCLYCAHMIIAISPFLIGVVLFVLMKKSSQEESPVDNEYYDKLEEAKDGSVGEFPSAEETQEKPYRFVLFLDEYYKTIFPESWNSVEAFGALYLFVLHLLVIGTFVRGIPHRLYFNRKANQYVGIWNGLLPFQNVSRTFSAADVTKPKLFFIYETNHSVVKIKGKDIWWICHFPSYHHAPLRYYC